MLCRINRGNQVLPIERVRQRRPNAESLRRGQTGEGVEPALGYGKANEAMLR